MANHTRSLGRLMTLVIGLGMALGAAADFKPVDGEQYREFFDPPNPVKGEALVGLSIVPPTAQAQRGTELQVWFLDSYQGRLTIETLAADGSFRGIGSVTGSADAPNDWTPVQISPETKTPGKERPADPRTLALAVRGDRPNEFLIAHWGEKPKTKEGLMLRFYVNGQRGDMSVRAGDTEFRCVRLEMPRPLRFDAYCDLPLAKLPPDYSVALIRRDRFSYEEQPITILH